MTKSILLATTILLLWVVWCVAVVMEIVPHLRRQLLFWDWLTAWILCVLPAVIVAFIVLYRTRIKSL